MAETPSQIRARKNWRAKNPQLSVCLPEEVYQKLFLLAQVRGMHSAAALARQTLLELVAKDDAMTPLGQRPPRSAPILESGGTYIDRTPLPQLPGIPAGFAHTLTVPPDQEDRALPYPVVQEPPGKPKKTKKGRVTNPAPVEQDDMSYRAGLDEATKPD